MPVSIENPQNVPLEPQAQRVLRMMFADYDRLVIKSRFTSGLSGSSVYLVRSIKKNAPDLPSVVKIDRYERIEKEWQAYKDHVQRRLSNIADIQGTPVNPPGSEYSGLWYPLAGSGIDDITSLSDYLKETKAEEVASFLEKHLLKYLSGWWKQTENYYDLNFRSVYNDFLPPNLVVECTEAVGTPGWLHPDSTDSHEWAIGQYVQATGFEVVKLVREKEGLILAVPKGPKAFHIQLNGVGDISGYEIGELIQRPFIGLIKETRQRQLINQAQPLVGLEIDLLTDFLSLPDGKKLPNPLTNLSHVLSRTMDVKLGPIHGDLSLENVLVDRDIKRVYIIDFVNARQNHVLRDLLHLEMTVINRLLSETMVEGETAAPLISDLYQRVHCAAALNKQVSPPAGQEKVFNILQTIRKAAQPLLHDSNKWGEYYCGLFIYLLGSLRYKDLDSMSVAPRPKQLAFWGAATILDLMNNDPDCSSFEAAKTTLSKSINSNVEPSISQESASNWDIDKLTAEWQSDALAHRLTLFNLVIKEFSMHELNNELAFTLGMDLDDLPSSGKNGKAQELIGYFERRGRIRELLEAVAKLRPNASWRK